MIMYNLNLTRIVCKKRVVWILITKELWIISSKVTKHLKWFSMKNKISKTYFSMFVCFISLFVFLSLSHFLLRGFSFNLNSGQFSLNNTREQKRGNENCTMKILSMFWVNIIIDWTPQFHFHHLYIHKKRGVFGLIFISNNLMVIIQKIKHIQYIQYQIHPKNVTY